MATHTLGIGGAHHIGPKPTIRILNWNCNHIKHKIPDLKNLIVDLGYPEVICLQETHLSPKSGLKIHNYKELRQAHDIESPGLSTFVREDINSCPISSFTDPILNYQTVEIFLSKVKFQISNVYLRNPLKRNISEKSLRDFLHKPNHIFVGDFNAKSQTWGNVIDDWAGTTIEKITLEYGSAVINTGEPTRIAQHERQKDSAIDLTIISDPFPYPSYMWETVKDCLGSDHRPCLTTLIGSGEIEKEIPSLLRFNTNKADWETFRQSLDAGGPTYDTDVEKHCTQIINQLTEAAKSAIPNNSQSMLRTTKHKKNTQKKETYWWNKNCEQAVRERRTALKKYTANKTPENKDEYRLKRNRATAVIIKTKKDSWRTFANNLNVQADPRKAWNEINSLCGRKVREKLSEPLMKDNQAAVTNIQKAEVLSDQFYHISSNKYLNEDFKQHKENYEARNTNLFDKETTLDKTYYNNPLTAREFQTALDQKKKSAPGGDSITYEIINQSGNKFKQKILDLYNHIWSSGTIPKIFKHAVVVPIPKPGKDKTDPASYRPISLTSHLGKLMETIVNKRLNFYLEENGLISNTQAGFRKNRQTLDQLIALESAIKTGQVRNKVVGAIFLDLEKAYDTMWRGGLLKNLKEMEIGGKMYNYILNFVTERTFQVKVGEALSGIRTQENGTPQGAVISPTLFNIAVNNINTAITDPNTHISQFADDCALWKNLGHLTAKKLKTKLRVIQTFQKEAEKLIQRLKSLGFKVNVKKTQAILFNFTAKKNIKLTLDKTEIETTNTVTFLGVTLDKSTTYKKHIEDLCKKTMNSLNLLKSLSHKGLHVPYTTKKVIYRSLIEARLAYGQELYIQSRPTYLKKLDAIQATALRHMSNTNRFTSTAALQVANNIEPLQIRREQALLKYWARCQLNKNNPTREKFRAPSQVTTKVDLDRETKPKYSTTWTAQIIAKELDIDMKNMAPLDTYTAPWCLAPINVDIELANKINKKEDLPNMMKNTTLDHIDTNYKNHYKVYTDGSKRGESVSTGVYSADLLLNLGDKITDDTSILTAELIAIKTAINNIKSTALENRQVVILTDSLSSAKTLNNPSEKQSRPDLTFRILETNQEIINNLNTRVTVCWIPAHCGIVGNEKADQKAKSTLENEETVNVGLGKNEIYSIIHDRMRNKWQKQWDSNPKGRHFYATTPKIGPTMLKFNKENKSINQLRMGKARYDIVETECTHCKKQLSTDHILLECPAHTHTRRCLEQVCSKYKTKYTTTALLDTKAPGEIKTLVKKLLKPFSIHI